MAFESGRALPIIEWRVRLSANRYPPRTKVQEKAFAEHALTGHTHRGDDLSAQLQNTADHCCRTCGHYGCKQDVPSCDEVAILCADDSGRITRMTSAR